MRPSIWECAWPIFTKFSELVECGWEWPVSHSMDVAMVTNYGSKLAQCTIIYCICIPQPTGELQRWWAQYHQQWRLFNRQKFGEFWSSNPGVYEAKLCPEEAKLCTAQFTRVCMVMRRCASLSCHLTCFMYQVSSLSCSRLIVVSAPKHAWKDVWAHAGL